MAESSLAIVQQLLTLCSDPENQSFIVNEEGCVSGLVTYLKNSDDNVVCMAAQAMQFLSSNADNIATLRVQPGLIANLTLLLESRNSSILEFAGAALNNLTVAGDVEVDAENCGAANENTSAAGATRATKAKKKKKKKKKKKQSIVLNVEGISDPDVCTAVERCLIMAAGVVSVTLETSRGNAIVVARADTTPEDLVTALADLGFEASVFDQKAPTPTGAKSAGLHYLDDEYNAEDHKETITTYGCTTLESRLEAERRKERTRELQQAKEEGFAARALRSATSWLW